MKHITFAAVVSVLIALLCPSLLAQTVTVSPDSIFQGESTTVSWSGFSGLVNLDVWAGESNTGTQANTQAPGTGSQVLDTTADPVWLNYGCRTDYRIRVVLKTDPENTFKFSNFFTVKCPQPSLQLMYPSGGETLYKGTEYSICWHSDNYSGNIKIHLYKGGTTPGYIFHTLGAREPVTRDCYPFNPLNEWLDDTDYYIGIATEDDHISSFSRAFTIATPITGCDTCLCPTDGMTIPPSSVTICNAVYTHTHGIRIQNASGIVINGNGATLDGLARIDDGIRITSSNNVTIKHFKLKNYLASIHLLNSNNCVIQDCIMENNQTGVWADSAPNTQIINNAFMDNFGSIDLFTSNGCLVQNNNSSSTQTGSALRIRSSGVTVKWNTFNYHAGDAIWYEAGSDNIVNYNNIYGNAGLNLNARWPIDARFNWWGSILCSQIIPKLTAPVTYDPALSNVYPKGSQVSCLNIYRLTVKSSPCEVGPIPICISPADTEERTDGFADCQGGFTRDYPENTMVFFEAPSSQNTVWLFDRWTQDTFEFPSPTGFSTPMNGDKLVTVYYKEYLPPIITHRVPSPLGETSSLLSIITTIAPGIGQLISATVSLRQSPSDPYSLVSLNQSSADLWVAHLSVPLDWTEVEYYVSATNDHGFSSTHGSFNLPHILPRTHPIPFIDSDSTPPKDPTPPETRAFIGNIDSRYPTVVLTHGLQDRTSNIDEAIGKLWTGTGTKQAANLITASLSASGGKANIVQYIWEEAFQRYSEPGLHCLLDSAPSPAAYKRAHENVQDAGLRLATELLSALGSDYDQPIHFIGHSLGTAVNAYAAATLLSQLVNVTRAQFTALDRPDHINDICFWNNAAEIRKYRFDSNWLARHLSNIRDNLVIKLDNYYALDGIGFGVGDVACASTDSHLIVYNHCNLKEPNDIDDLIFNEVFDNNHSGVQEWYRWTIAPNGFGSTYCPDFETHRPRFNPSIHSSLNPCEAGWYYSVVGNPDNFDNLSAKSSCSTSVIDEPLQLSDPESFECSFESEQGRITLVRCAEASSPYFVSNLFVPPTASGFSFWYTFSNPGDGDYAAILIDAAFVWKVSGLSAPIAQLIDSKEISLSGLDPGIHRLTVALYGAGDPNFSFALQDFRCILRTESIYVRGDSNTDGEVDISDVISILFGLFVADNILPCKKAADINDNGAVDISDGVFLLNYLFLSGDTIPDPHPFCGTDLTSDDLSCDNAAGCH